MPTRKTLQRAYVLHRRPYSNTSLIVELFSHDHGRNTVVARSARGLKSRYKGKLELFFPLLVSWFGQHELKTLGDIELYDSPILLDGERLLCGFYLNELLLRLLYRDDPYPQLFAAYQRALHQLSQAADVHSVLRHFEKTLLHELGYGLPLECELETGQPFVAENYYQYLPEHGFVRAQSNDAQLMIFSGHSLIALQQDRFDDTTTRQEIKRLMRIAIGRHLGTKPLCSRGLLK